MNIDLGIEALSPQLTGIGRYTLELMRGLQVHADIGSLRTMYQNREIGDTIRLLQGEKPFSRYQNNKLYTVLMKTRAHLRPRLSLYHGPNFMLPSGIEGGIITVHDMSVLKFPETHPP